MRKIFILPIITAAFMMLCPAAGFTKTKDSLFVTPLIAGGNITVGEVRVWNDDTNIYVKYVINDSSWCLRETNLAVESSKSLLPKISHCPIPDKFEFQDKLDCATEHMYTIPLRWSPGTKVYIAAHAVVGSICGYEDPDLALFAGTLPAEATMTTNDPYLDGPAYLPAIDVADADDLLTGTHDGWCLSTALRVDAGVQYNANVFSSYATLPDGLVDFPGNLDKINWILNQQFVGKHTQCNPDLPVYTYGSVQRAIWSLIDDENSNLSLGPYSRCQVAEILDGAEEYGLFYEPGCKEFVGVVLQPFDGQGLPAQPVIIPVPLPCEPKICSEQTAWGAGNNFKKCDYNGAMYIKYRINKDKKPRYKSKAQGQKTVTAAEQTKIKNPIGIELD